MDAIEFAQQIVDIIHRRQPGGASFAELADEWPEHFMNGDMEMCLNGGRVSNVVLWSGLSQLAIDAIKYARENLSVKVSGTVELIYIIDGCTLKLPLAKTMRHYEKPHWAPVVLKLRNEARKYN